MEQSQSNGSSDQSTSQSNVTMVTLDEEMDQSTKPTDSSHLEDASNGNKETSNTDQHTQDKDGNNEESSSTSGESTKKLKIKSLNFLVEDTPTASSNSSEFTIGDIVEHGDFVSSDESGVMHLKITNVMSVDESITGCTVSEDDKDVFANIQIASVTTLMDDDPCSPVPIKDKADGSTQVADAASGSSVPESPAAAGGVPSLKIVNLQSLTLSEGSSTPSTAMCVVPQTEAASAARDTSSKNVFYIIRSSLVVPRNCINCYKTLVCVFRVMAMKPQPQDCSSYLCSDQCSSTWQLHLPTSSAIDKPRKYFERVCGMCGNDINETNKGLFSWETREFCNKLCLADHIGYVGQRCRQCESTVRLLHMGKYCVRFGSDIYQFCSNTCLETYKVNIQVCCYCQKNLLSISSKEQKDVISVASKKYCSVKCHRRALRKDINQQYYSEKKSCTVCTGMVLPRFEFLRGAETSYLCSQPCLNVYKFANNYKAVNCCLCLRLLCVENVTHFLYHNNGQLRVFCSTSCTNVFILSTRRIVTCCFCKVKKYNFDMIHLHDETAASYYCSVCCLNLHKQKTIVEDDVPSISPAPPVPAISGGSSSVTLPTTPLLPLTASTSTSTTATPSASKPPTQPPASQLTQCNMCSNISPAQFHMVMSDNTLRNFCSFPCASQYKITYGFLVSNKNNAAAAAAAQAKPRQDEAPAPASAPAPAPAPAPATATATATAQKDTAKPPESAANSLRSFRASKTVAAKVATPPTMAPPVKSVPAKPAPAMPVVPKKTETEIFLERIKAMMAPKVMVNKSIMCKPVKSAATVELEKMIKEDKDIKGVSVIGKDGKERIFIPVPIPVYVPLPMAMYSIPTPIPIFLPLPIPIPVIIPTSAENNEQVWSTIEKLRKKYGGSDDAKKDDVAGSSAEEKNDDATGSSAVEKKDDATSSSTVEKKDDAAGSSAVEKKDNAAGSSAEEKKDEVTLSKDCEESTTSNNKAISVGYTEMTSGEKTTQSSSKDDENGQKSSEQSSSEEHNDQEKQSTKDAVSLQEKVRDADMEKDEDEDEDEGANTATKEDELSEEDQKAASFLNNIEDQIQSFHIRGTDSDGGVHRQEEGRGVKRGRDDSESGGGNKRARSDEDGDNRIWIAPGLESWRTWVKQQTSIPEDLTSMRSTELGSALALYVQQVRKPNGNAFHPDMLYYLLLGLQQHLFENGKNYCIFLDSVFHKFNTAFDGIIAEFAEGLAAAGLRGTAPSTRIVEQDMWECRLLGAHTPHVLLNTLFYFNTKLFRLKTVEQHTSLSFSLIHKEWQTVDNERCAVLKFYPDGGGGENSKVCYEMSENKEDPLRCPVKLYEFYLSKCPGDARSSRGQYYVYPESSCLPDSAVWYTDRPLTSDSVAMMLHRALLVRELQEALVQ